MRLAIEAARAGHLLLLDEGPEGILYCLCPSHFAPDTRLSVGYCELPQAGSRYDSFVVTGQPGREHLLAGVCGAVETMPQSCLNWRVKLQAVLDLFPLRSHNNAYLAGFR